MIPQLLGGVGLFLLGMVLLTDGLKAAAGDALRDALARVTGGTWRALLTGVGATALVQSSSATVLTTIGFVSAGLLAFPQAIGVILGANLGTTSTGWLVAVLGLRLSIGTIALPVVGVGALLRLLGRGRVSDVGLALAGFGLIFVGIDVLQTGMEALAGRMDPSAFPGATFLGRLALVGIGVAMTVVMQSSSAAVATTLTALHAGTIGLEQAAILVIGQNMGTTVKAALVAIGASVPARRTVVAHILFNVITAILALLLVPLFLWAVQAAEGMAWLGAGGAVSLAAFHTAFNALGVLVLLPVLGPFAALVARAVPERGPHLTRHLDPSVRQVPEVALEAARRTVGEIRRNLVEALAAALADRRESGELAATVAAADEALAETGRFLGQLRTSSTESPRHHDRHVGVLHALEHLERLAQLLGKVPRSSVLYGDPVLAEARGWIREALNGTVSAVAAGDGALDAEAEADALAGLSRRLAGRRRVHRREVLDRTAAGVLSPDRVLEVLEAMRWLDAAAYHLWRSTAHLTAAGRGEVAEPPAALHEFELPGEVPA